MPPNGSQPNYDTPLLGDLDSLATATKLSYKYTTDTDLEAPPDPRFLDNSQVAHDCSKGKCATYGVLLCLAVAGLSGFAISAGISRSAVNSSGKSSSFRDGGEVNDAVRTFCEGKWPADRPLSEWEMERVVDISGAFNDIGEDCAAKVGPLVGKWDVRNVERAEFLFDGVGDMSSWDIADWDLSSLTSATNMFCGTSGGAAKVHVAQEWANEECGLL